jgi:hypothetical protein
VSIGGLSLRLLPATALAWVLQSGCCAAAPLDMLKICATESKDIVGIAALEAACPGLGAALTSLGLDREFDPGWREKLTARNLADAAYLAQSHVASGSTSALDVSTVPNILAGLEVAAPPETVSLWRQFGAWLDGWFHRHGTAFSSLNRWLAYVAKSVGLLNAIVYLLIAAIVVAAGWVIYSELRAAGLFGAERRRMASQSTHVRGTSEGAGVPVTEAISLAASVAMLLRQLVDALARTGRLGANRGLTYRELVERSAFDNRLQQGVFADVAGAAEAVKYGPRAAASPHLAKVLEEGEVLLRHLSKMPPSP